MWFMPTSRGLRGAGCLSCGMVGAPDPVAAVAIRLAVMRVIWGGGRGTGRECEASRRDRSPRSAAVLFEPHRLPMGRARVGYAPSLLAGGQQAARRQRFLEHQPLERIQHMGVVGRAVVRIARRLGTRD